MADGEYTQYLEDSGVGPFETSDVDNVGVLNDIGVEVEEGNDNTSNYPDEVSRLQKNNPELWNHIVNLQRSNDYMRGQFDTIQQSMNNEQTEQQSEQSDEPPIPPGVTKEHLDMFRQMADYFGYVPRQELEANRMEEVSSDYVNDSMRQAVEDFGGSFGYVNANGTVSLRPEVQQRLRNRLAALEDPARGITPRDLYILEFGSEPTMDQMQRIERPRRNRGVVVRRSAPGGNRNVRIYDPNKNESADDVFNRAWALGRMQLNQ